MENQASADRRELRRFETLISALYKQVYDVVSSEEGLQGYRTAARLYNRYVEKIDSVLPPSFRGLAEPVSIPELDEDDEDELKTFLSELLFALSQLRSLVSAAGDDGTHRVHVETRLHGRHAAHPRYHGHARPSSSPMPPMPPMPPVPPMPAISPMPGVQREAWQDWLQELRDAWKEWGRQFRQSYQAYFLTEPAPASEQSSRDLEACRRDILSRVESKEITVEEAMAMLEKLRKPQDPSPTGDDDSEE